MTSTYRPVQNLANLSDQELVARFQAEGDQDALLTLLNKHKHLATAVARKFRLDQPEEDFIQELYLVLYEKLSSHPQIGNFAGWFRTMARNRILDKLRKQARNEQFLSYEKQRPHQYYQQVAERMDQRTLSQMALSHVNAAEASCLHLRYYEDMSYQEVADSLGLSFKQVCGRLGRGLNKMRAGFNV